MDLHQLRVSNSRMTNRKLYLCQWVRVRGKRKRERESEVIHTVADSIMLRDMTGEVIRKVDIAAHNSTERCDCWSFSRAKRARITSALSSRRMGFGLWQKPRTYISKVISLVRHVSRRWCLNIRKPERESRSCCDRTCDCDRLTIRRAFRTKN